MLVKYPKSSVGEIGIDPNTKGDLGVRMDEQEIIFLKQLAIAKELKRPRVCCRGVWDKLISLIDQSSPCLQDL